MRRTILFSVIVLLLVAPLAGGASADKPSRGCPPAFDLGYAVGDQDGRLTYEEDLELPMIQAGLDAEVYTEAQLAAGFDFVDKNGDGYVCGQSWPSNAALQYFFNGVDNTAVGPGS